jgi:uncharacterized protein (TIGR03067 family)
MKTMAIPMVVTVLLSTATLHADDTKLYGTWVAVEATQDGEKVSDDLAKSARLVLTDGKYTASLGDVTETGTYTVDRSRKPNWIDMKPANGGRKGKVNPGVFEQDGDTLRVNFNLQTFRRPTDLTSTAENKNFVVVYQRMK